MDDKGEIVSSCDVDENIALQIWTKGLSPRLVVFNKNKNSRKLIRLSWMEKRDRKLAVKGKGRTESFSYAIADLVPILQGSFPNMPCTRRFVPGFGNLPFSWRRSSTFRRSSRTGGS